MFARLCHDFKKGAVMSSLLYGMINNRANETYGGPVITASTYDIWVKHWFKTAEDIQIEFASQELYKTADAIYNIIQEQKKYCKEYLDKAK